MNHNRTRSPVPVRCPHDGRHRHGKHTTYLMDRCGCDPCTEAMREAQRARRRRKAYGTDITVPAAPVRDHVNKLRASGYGMDSIAAQTGVPAATIHGLLYPRRLDDGTYKPVVNMLRRNAEALMALQAIDPESCLDRARTDATGTRRRLQALACAGWSMNELAARRGSLNKKTLHAIASGATETVYGSTYREVRDLYDEMWDTKPDETDRYQRASSARTRARAARAGWQPALAWDDETIDDPNAKPAETRRTKPTAAERFSEWLHLVQCGVSHEHAAAQAGMEIRTITRYAHRIGRQDIVAVLGPAVYYARRKGGSGVNDEMTLRANLPARREVAA